MATQIEYFKHLSEHLREFSLAPLAQFAEPDCGEEMDAESPMESLAATELLENDSQPDRQTESAARNDEQLGNVNDIPALPALTDPHIQELLDSLKFDEMDSRYLSIEPAQEDTGGWLLNNSEYLDWLDEAKLPDHHGFLWMKGVPGAGKSTLMKFALSSTRKSSENRTIVSFFFNIRGTDLERSAIGMYRSLLLQLLTRMPQLQSVFESLKLTSWNCSSDHKWSMEALKDLFQQVIQSLGQNPVACFIDALDECYEDQVRDMVAFFQDLSAIAVPAGIRFQVFFSSRHYPHITISRGLTLVLEHQAGHDKDIISYINSKLRTGRSLSTDTLRSHIRQKSSGVFLWVVLVVNILNREYDIGRGVRHLQQDLSKLPGGLHQLFQYIITRDCRNRDDLLLCVQWVLFARQPLTPEQLYFAILSGTEPDYLSEWDQKDMPLSAIERFIGNCSNGLVKATESNGFPTVEFIHESVRDFFLVEDAIEVVWPGLRTNFEGQSHDRLKQCCLRYMSAGVANRLEIEEAVPLASSPEGHALRQKLSTKFPFFQYAVENVLWHADKAQRGGACQKSSLIEFDLPRWLHLRNAVERFDGRRHTPKASLLYILGEYNLPSLIQAYENNLHSFDVEDERYGPPILAASICGSQEAVTAMLEAQRQARQDLSTAETKWEAPGRSNRVFHHQFSYSKERGLLSYLAASGDDILLSYALAISTSNIDGKGSLGQTPLGLAAGNGHEAVVKLLLATGQVDVDAKDSLGQTPLSLAARNGHAAVVKVLLDSGQVAVDGKDDFGQTPLNLATGNGHEAVVKLLLATGQVDVDAKDYSGRTPLSSATGNGHEAVVKLLLATGQVAVNCKNTLGQTPLSLAAENGYTAIAKLLRDAGQVVVAEDNSAQTPLS